MEWLMTSAAAVPAIPAHPATTTYHATPTTYHATPTTYHATPTIAENAVHKVNSAVTEDALAFVTHAAPIITNGWGPIVAVPIYARGI